MDCFLALGLEACRTEALGGHVAACAECGHHHIAYNSCKNRHCPKCQGLAARDWMAARVQDLLPVEYFHVVFTLPARIAQIAYWNQKVVCDLLFKASAETLITIAADPRHLGARIGMTSVLHTWGSALTHHPHVHMIIPGGGMSQDGARWNSKTPKTAKQRLKARNQMRFHTASALCELSAIEAIFGTQIPKRTFRLCRFRD